MWFKELRFSLSCRNNAKKYSSTLLVEELGTTSFPDSAVTIDSSLVSPSPQVRRVGVRLDSSLSFQSRINTAACSAHFHFIDRLRPHLTVHSGHVILSSLVSLKKTSIRSDRPRSLHHLQNLILWSHRPGSPAAALASQNLQNQIKTPAP